MILYVSTRIYTQYKSKSYQEELTKVQPKIESLIGKVRQNSTFAPQNSEDATDLIYSLSKVQLTLNSKSCESLIKSTNQAPQVPAEIVKELYQSGAKWLEYSVPPNLDEQLVWMDELEKRSSILFHSTSLGECILNQIPSKPFLAILGSDYRFPEINFEGQISAWTKIALIVSLRDKKSAQIASRRILNLARALLNSDEFYTLIEGIRVLGILNTYVKNSKAKSSVIFFPPLEEINETILFVRILKATFNVLAPKSMILESFSHSSPLPGICATLTSRLDNTNRIQAIGFSAPKKRESQPFMQLAKSNSKHCRIQPALLSFEKMITSRGKETNFYSNAWNISLKTIQSIILVYSGIQFTDALAYEKGELENLFREHQY